MSIETGSVHTPDPTCTLCGETLQKNWICCPYCGSPVSRSAAPVRPRPNPFGAPAPRPAAKPDAFRIENGVLVKYTGTDADVVIPAGVTAIGNKAFDRQFQVVSVTVPEGVRSIGESAFTVCYKLRTVTLPHSLEEIGASAFSYCDSLTTVNVPAGTKVGQRAFAGCKALADDNGFVIIDNVLYHSFHKQKRVVVPAGVTAVDGWAFYQSKNAEEIVLPEGVTRIGKMAFHGCTSLTTLILPESLTTLADEVFTGCPALAELTLPAALTTVGRDLFSDCKTIHLSDHAAPQVREAVNAFFARKAQEEADRLAQEQARAEKLAWESAFTARAVAQEQLHHFWDAHRTELDWAGYQQLVSLMKNWVQGTGKHDQRRWAEGENELSFWGSFEHWIGHDDTVTETVKMSLTLAEDQSEQPWRPAHSVEGVCSSIPCAGVYLLRDQSDVTEDEWSFDNVVDQDWLLKEPLGLKGVWLFKAFEESDR